MNIRLSLFAIMFLTSTFLFVACSSNNDSGGGSIGGGGHGSDDHIMCTQVMAIMYPSGNGSCKLVGNGCQISDFEAQGYTALMDITKCKEHCSDADCESFQPTVPIE